MATEALVRTAQRDVQRGELWPEATRSDPRIIMGPVVMAARWSLVYTDETFPPMAMLVKQHAGLIVRGLAQP